MARVQYKGKIQRTMAQYEALTTLEQYADYDITDHPNVCITNAQMVYALTCKRLFPVNDTYVCSDEGNYIKGHIYRIVVNENTKSWDDITAYIKGGTFDGNIVITGNLTVQGTTVSENTQSLTVKDNIIVTNSDKIDLQSKLSGLAINKNSVDTYGIVYDPADDTVKLGLGNVSDDGNFAFDTGEGAPIVIRDDSSKLVNEHLVQWDSTNNKIVDSGKSINDFVVAATSTGLPRVYGIDTNGNQQIYNMTSTSVLGSAVVQRDGLGRIYVRTATESSPYIDNEAVNKKYVDEHSGSSITVDSALSETSENPVQNKVITTELNKKIGNYQDATYAGGIKITPPPEEDSGIATSLQCGDIDGTVNALIGVTVDKNATEVGQKAQAVILVQGSAASQIVANDNGNIRVDGRDLKVYTAENEGIYVNDSKVLTERVYESEVTATNKKYQGIIQEGEMPLGSSQAGIPCIHIQNQEEGVGKPHSDVYIGSDEIVVTPGNGNDSFLKMNSSELEITNKYADNKQSKLMINENMTGFLCSSDNAYLAGVFNNIPALGTFFGNGIGFKDDKVYYTTSSDLFNSDTLNPEYEVATVGSVKNIVKGNVKTLTYDNTTLADHINEILGYINTENGGNLINVNFKVASAVNGEMKSVINTLSTNTLTNSSSTVAIINADEMITLNIGTIRNGSTSGKKVTFTCANDTNICSFTNVDMSNINETATATISGQEIDFGTGTIITNYFKGIDILNTTLEHLVINYYTI